MDVETLLGAIRRYWAAVLAVLLMTLVAVVVVPSRITAEYEAEGAVVLLSPSTIQGNLGEEVNVNPWSRFGGAEAGAAAAIVAILGAGTVEKRLIEEYPDVTSFVVSINPSNGAIIQLAVRAETAESALAAYDQAFDMLETELAARQRQSGAEEETWLQAQVLTQPDGAEEFPGSETRAMLAVAALGVVAAVSAAVMLDTVVTPRRRQRAGTTVAGAATQQVPAAPSRPSSSSPASSNSWDRLRDLRPDEGTSSRFRLLQRKDGT